MAQLHYIAEVRSGRILELPAEAVELHLKPGDRIEVQIDVPATAGTPSDPDPTLALIESWIAQAPTDPEAIREAEEDLLELKRNLNLPRKRAGARLHFPEVE